MQNSIEITDVGLQENKGKWKYFTIAYTDLKDGSAHEHKIVSFDEENWKIFRNAKRGEIYVYDVVKEGEYWRWKNVEKQGASESKAKDAAAPNATKEVAKPFAPRTNFETPEERHTRQILIVRQSSVASAVAFLKDRTTDPSDVLDLASQMVAFVMAGTEFASTANPQVEVVPAKKAGRPKKVDTNEHEDEDDIPF